MHRSTPVLVSAIVATLLSGCQSSLLDLKDDTVFQQTIPVCQTDSECDKVWAAARAWVMKATSQGLAVDTSERIQTRPSDVEALDWQTDIRVDKRPLGDGKYQIVIGIDCNNTFNNCDPERKKMRRFNRDMAGYVSSNQSQEILRIFTDDDDMDALFSSYAASLNQAALRAHAQKYYLPTTVISGDNVRQLNTIDEVIDFLKQGRARLGAGEIARIEATNQQVLSSSQTTAIVKLQWNFYADNDDLKYSQKATYNLIKVGKAWKILFVSFQD